MTEWIERAKDGDGEAFIRLMEENKHSLYKIARSFFPSEADAEDAVSQTVLDAWEKLGTLRKTAFFKTWLTRILINNCKDILRQNAHLTHPEPMPERAADDPDPGDLGFRTLLDCLDAPSRPIFALYYGEGFRVREIARLLGLPPGTVTARLKRGRDKLRQCLQEDER